ncbi:MAG: RNA polymerase sigma factor [Planctomycetaceae bacterium]
MTSDDQFQTNLSLLDDTQSYLRQLLEQKAPDSVLTQAWDRFYLMYNDLIVRFARSRGLRGEDLYDCTQEVWKTVTEKLVEFERPEDRPGLRAWLFSIVRSKVIDLTRRQKRHVAQRLDAAIEVGAEPVSDEPDPSDVLDRQWAQALLESAIAELGRHVSARNHQVLRLRLLEHKSAPEIAATLDLTSEQVHYRQHRMIKKLRAHLALYSGEPLGKRH